jgi:16S rRNA (adenine(1408)-N(1))-methyltransferase
VRRVAAAEPDCAVIGVDAAVEALRETSRKLGAKPARGGLPNALCGRLALADAPGELAGLADRLTVLLPWGELLAAVARPDVGGLARLRGLCREGAGLRVVFGHGPEAEAGVVRELGLPAFSESSLAMLEARYREAGFEVHARWMPLEEVRALPTTWAKRLAFSGHARTFVEVRGRALTP